MKAKKSAPKLKPSQRKKWQLLLRKYAANPADGSLGTTERYNVVIDTNILVSAILYSGTPELVLRYTLERQSLVLSDYIIDEFMAYLAVVRPRVPQKWKTAVRRMLQKYVTVVDQKYVIKVRDVNDTDIIGLAMAASAFIVTGDKDLLDYRNDAHVVILSVKEYCEIFEIDIN